MGGGRDRPAGHNSNTNTLTEEIGGDGGVQSKTQLCWDDLYFHNTYTYNFYLDKRREGDVKAGLGHQKCVFTFFLALVNMCVLRRRVCHHGLN